MSSTNDDTRTHDEQFIIDGAIDVSVSRRGWGKRMLLSATALGVLFASAKPQEAEAAPPTDTWKLGGNTGVSSDGTNFIGPANSAPLIFKTAGVERMRINSAGNIGIGMAVPGARLQVEVANGIAVLAKHTATTGDAAALRGETSATVANASAVHGIVKSTAPGASSAGVRGENNATSVNGAGVLGRHAGTGSGVYGTAPSGYGVTGTGTTGVYGTGTTGVYGSGTTGIVGYGTTGIYGSGNNIGVYGVSTETNSNGVYGGRTANNGAGVHGSGGEYAVLGDGSPSTAGVRGDSGYVGVWGEGGTYAVYGKATGTTGANFGVFGESVSPQGYGGYFKGQVHVEGTLSKGNGAFKIDHPLDPANKYLYHSFVESPDMKNIYDGVVVLDVRGEATVTMPDWFEALNMDFRYQLTCIGGYAPVYIAEKIKDNRFKIAGGKANMEVSWQVTGTRQDAYAKANPIPVEEHKSSVERGKYLHPEAFGKPTAMAVMQNPTASDGSAQSPLPKHPARQQQPPRPPQEPTPITSE